MNWTGETSRSAKNQYVLTIAVTLAALVILTVYTFESFYETARRDAISLGESTLSLQNEHLSRYLQKGVDVLQATSVTADYLIRSDASAEDIQKMLSSQKEEYAQEIDENFTSVYGWIKGEYIDGSGRVPTEGYVATERVWYTDAVKAGGSPVIASPYIDASTGTIMITISRLLCDGDSVLALDCTMDEFQNIIINDNPLGEKGCGFFCYDSGMVVAHTDPAEKGKNYLEDDGKKAALEKMFSEEASSFRMEYDGEVQMIFSSRVMDDWYIAKVISENELFASVQTILLRNVLISVGVFVLITVFCTLSLKSVRNYESRLEASSKNVQRMLKQTIEALSSAVDAKDRYTSGHSERVAEYSKLIAKRMGKSESEQENIYFAGLLHDVGKIRIPDDIINKPGKLTPEEFEYIKLHPVAGYHILRDISMAGQYRFSDGARFHHERYDGKGYPSGLTAENIPEIARIIGVADAYDAMASNRSYRSALPQEDVRAEIVRCSGTQFDPKIASVMLELIDEDTEYSLREQESLKRTILVVDDDEITTEIVTQILLDDGRYIVMCAPDGPEALEIMESIPVDLVLLDIEMPKLNGFDTLRSINEKWDVPVVFMSVDKDWSTIQRADDMGVQNYITKPISALALKEVVHSILNR